MTGANGARVGTTQDLLAQIHGLSIVSRLLELDFNLQMPDFILAHLNTTIKRKCNSGIECREQGIEFHPGKSAEAAIVPKNGYIYWAEVEILHRATRVVGMHMTVFSQSRKYQCIPGPIPTVTELCLGHQIVSAPL